MSGDRTPRQGMRKLILATAAVLAAVVFFLLATLPPRPAALSLAGADADLVRRTVRGAFHVHTSRSDGAEQRTAIAEAAARASLGFIVFTDHGDATRPPEPPAYVGGVLCIDGVEISTNGGHYVALGLDAAPYPLGGEAAAVVEDVHRLGGFGIAAHPAHPRAELAWSDPAAPIDGIEWINADAEWRTEGRFALARTIFDYFIRPAPAIASVLDRPAQTLARWDAMSRGRRVVALAALDAHGAGRTARHEGDGARLAVGPSYEASFRTLSNRVVLDRALDGDAVSDARRLLDAIRRGSVYSVVDAISPDAAVDLAQSPARVASELPAGAEVATVRGEMASRLEVRVPGAPGEPPIPWILTNWSYAREPVVSGGASVAPVPGGQPVAMDAWRLEKDPQSGGAVALQSGLLTLQYSLSSGEPRDQFVAAATDLTDARPLEAIVIRAKATQPMRLSVQLRFPPDHRRWRKSVYLDASEREVVVPVGDMAPAERGSAAMPPAHTARSLLLVVDLVNARPGDHGAVTIREVRVSGG